MDQNCESIHSLVIMNQPTLYLVAGLGIFNIIFTTQKSWESETVHDWF